MSDVEPLQRQNRAAHTTKQVPQNPLSHVHICSTLRGNTNTHTQEYIKQTHTHTHAYGQSEPSTQIYQTQQIYEIHTYRGHTHPRPRSECGTSLLSGS